VRGPGGDPEAEFAGEFTQAVGGSVQRVPVELGERFEVSSRVTGQRTFREMGDAGAAAGGRARLAGYPRGVLGHVGAHGNWQVATFRTVMARI
jgi:hypothetical protein